MSYRTLKNGVKALTPAPIVESVHEKLVNKRLWNQYKQDYRRYKDNALLGTKEPTQKNLLGIITFKTHSVEKGLSHQDFRPGFGKTSSLRELDLYLTEYKKLSYDLTHPYIKNAISVLREYADKHDSLGENIDWFKERFSFWLERENLKTAGAKTLNHKDSSMKNFRELAKNRYSVREYSSEPVDVADIMDAINISMKTPSVCNRSPWSVKIITDKDRMQELLKLQGGFGGYSMPDKLLLITVHTSYFNGLGERNQPYIEGGLFTMSLTYALEYKNIAAVALNAMFTNDVTEKIKSILKLDDDEILITFLGTGNFSGKDVVAKSFRPESTEIVQIY